MQRQLWRLTTRCLATAPNAALSRTARRRGFLETPLGKQWDTLSRANPACITLFQVGEFYEVYGDQAAVVSKAMGIALTRKADVHMAGVPVASLPSHLPRLVRAGFRVAICDQVTEPSAAQKSKLIRRQVSRIVSPGTLLEDELLEPRQNTYLLALVTQEYQSFGLAWIDMSTGVTGCYCAANPDQVREAIARLAPAEILVSNLNRGHIQTHLQSLGLPSECWTTVTPPVNAPVVDAKEELSVVERLAVSQLTEYASASQCGKAFRIGPVRRVQAATTMSIDPSSRRALELTCTSLSGTRRGSLLWAIDQTITPAGARLLERRIKEPLSNLAEIESRLDLVQFFFDDSDLTQRVRRLLHETQDLERALSRTVLRRSGPSDLAAIGSTLRVARQIQGILPLHKLGSSAELLASLGPSLENKIEACLVAPAPATTNYGSFIQREYCEELCKWSEIESRAGEKQHELAVRYRNVTKASTLKIIDVPSTGLCVVVSLREKRKLEESTALTFRPVSMGGLKSVARYTTDDTVSLDYELRNSRLQKRELEVALFEELCSEVEERAEDILHTARKLANIDLSTALAKTAQERSYVRPTVLPAGGEPAWFVQGGRHPAVERSTQLEYPTGYVPNDCTLNSKQRCWILTGPNMGGKSTFLRQQALIAVLAQMGSFVPAKNCTMSIVDRLFCRVTSGDNVSQNKSTFLIEMEETARLLRFASHDSLVLIDEVGRGTSYDDGVCIAKAVLEHLVEVNKSRSIFATHFSRELSAICESLGGTAWHETSMSGTGTELAPNFTVSPGRKGKPSPSYGLWTAAKAGIPKAVIDRATYLHRLQSQTS